MSTQPKWAEPADPPAPAAPAAAAGETAALGDLRFRALLDDEGWANLAPEVRARFARKAGPGQSIVFSGQVTEWHATRVGRLLAWACCAIGGPLPIRCVEGGASVVTITEDPRGGGQTWTRMYARRTGFPQVIHSSKRFAGPTGLEEHVGRGVGMTLDVAAEDGGIAFRSVRYFMQVLGRRCYLPSWLSPGALTVRHDPIDATHFEFSLTIDHPRLGCILSQTVVFRETGQ